MTVGTAIRKVTRLGAPVLRAKTRELSPAEILSPDVRRLVAEMEATMRVYEGVGIAANQCGEGLAGFLMALDPGSARCPEGIPRTVVFNPKVVFLGEERLEDWEGCLSVPGLRGRVPRFARLELSGLGEDAEPFTRVYEGFPARVVQHECDHLAGFVYLDRMDGLSTLAYLSQV
jgi:peptide deformylase